MDSKPEIKHYDTAIHPRLSAVTVSPPWRELLLRIVRHGRRFLFPVKPASEAGIGAVAGEQGVTFRVWAPHAKHIMVSGTFNRWSGERHPLASEDNGYWSTNIPTARPGDEFKYVVHYGSTRKFHSDPYARDIVSGSNNGVICETTSQSQEGSPTWMPKWNQLVIYELHVGTFNRETGMMPGHFQGIIEKLPYLRDLGVNALELMPIAEFAGDYSWGYNPAHPFAITRTYGGREAFRTLVDAAHDEGIAIIVDVVYNHFGPENLSLWQFDGWQENGKGGIYFYNDWRSTTPWADTRPDYGRPEVRQYIRDNALMWLDEYQVDGLRWDATAWIRNVYGHDGDALGDLEDGWGLMRWVNDEMTHRRPWAISIAEDLRGNNWLTKPTMDGGAGFNTQWDDRFVHPVRQAIIAADDEQRDLDAVAAAIQSSYSGDVFNRVIYTESHDEVANGKARVPEEIAPGAAGSPSARRRAALGAALVFTSPGIPMIFQGQEFLESGWFEDTRPLDWQKAQSNAGLVDYYRDLIRLRRNMDGRTLGLTGQNTQILHLDNELKWLAVHRWELGGAGDDVVIIANFSNQVQESVAIEFPHSGIWQIRLDSGQPRYGLAPSEHQRAIVAIEAESSIVTIAPYGVLIFSQEPAQ